MTYRSTPGGTLGCALIALLLGSSTACVGRAGAAGTVGPPVPSKSATDDRRVCTETVTVCDGSLVTASGATTPRTLATRFADIANVLDFGAKGDGITDDTAAIQAALNAAAPPGPGVLQVPTPPVFYNVTAPLRVPHGVSVRGGMHSAFIGGYVADLPRIQKTTRTTVGIPRFDDHTVVDRDVVFYIDPAWSDASGGAPGGFFPQEVELRGLSIRGSDASSTIAVYFEQGSRLLVADSDFSGVKHAFYGRNVWSSRFERVKATARFDVEVGGTSLTFLNVASGGSPAGFDGYHLNNVTYSSFINTTSDHFSQTAYELRGCKGLALIGVGAEAGNGGAPNQGSMFAFNGNNRVTVIGAFSVTKTGSTFPIVSVGDGDVVTFINGDFSAFQGAAPSVVDVYATSAARVTFQDSIFVDRSESNLRVRFDSPGRNRSVLAVLHNGQQKTYRDGSVTANELGTATITAPEGADALTLTPGAKINMGSARILQGTGSPESLVPAGVGSLFLRTDGAPGTSLYVKQSGAGATGWAPVTP